MKKQQITRKDYTTWGAPYQLSLPLNIECRIPANDSVRLLRHFIGGMDLRELHKTYSRIEKKKASPRQMLAIAVYANMNGIRSSRKIESACKRDINFMYLLEGKPAPDHSAIARFKQLHLAPCMKTLFAEMCLSLDGMGELSGEQIFIDGTKIESCANKYTFVWKKSVTKQMGKLMEKIPDLFAEAAEDFGVRLDFPEGIRLRHMKRLRRRLKAYRKSMGIEFGHGSGKRKTALQRLTEKLDEATRRIKDYTKKLFIAGGDGTAIPRRTKTRPSCG